MAKIKNGMIVFMRDQVIPGPKLLDIEITNTFPLISLTKKTYLISASGATEVLNGYDHLAVPPDFRLHISGPKDHIFFDATSVWNSLEESFKEPLHYFSVIGLPSRITQELVQPGETRTWHEAAIICPSKDAQFNDATRLFVDFFLHPSPMDLNLLHKFPFFMDGLRLATDRSGALIGPYSFESIQRRNKSIADVAFTMRFGFANIEDNESMYIYSPLDIFQKRPRI
jgi:hypothetical protein